MSSVVIAFSKHISARSQEETLSGSSRGGGWSLKFGSFSVLGVFAEVSPSQSQCDDGEGQKQRFQVFLQRSARPLVIGRENDPLESKMEGASTIAKWLRCT